MSLSFFIARRYLFTKKSHNAINIISAIAVAGIALATMAMVVTMSVFNGFRDLISTLFTTFDPQLVVVPALGKTAAQDDPTLQRIRQHKGVAAASATFEDNALILFRGHPLVVRIKGVDSQFTTVTQLPTILSDTNGKRVSSTHPIQWRAAEIAYGIIGEGLAQQIGVQNLNDLQLCAPKQGERINLSNPIESFSVDNIHSNGLLFKVDQRKYDDHLILTDLDFATHLFEKEGQLSRLELRLRPGVDEARVKEELRAWAGQEFQVLDRVEQQAEVYNIMQLEKLIAYVFLTFIILLACFNIISSLSMLIIEKRGDVLTLRHLGLNNARIRSLFMTEGRLISLLGAIVGVVLGLLLCWLQQEYGLIKLGNNGNNFIVRAYPISVHLDDIALVFFTVLAVGFLAVWYPVHALSKRLLQ
ncbi:MAG: FtsX-like permease family protein [Bacteroidales bacterium]|nr:FtsX-like permease family protein [Bacteroidales bacterium]